MSEITFFGNTDVGQKRSNNEDAFIVQNIWDEKHILAVAIDGVGGYNGGEVASSTARKCIIEYLNSYSNGERLDLLKQAVVFANNTIFSERKKETQYSKMCCVLTAILIELENNRINMAHVGDTRLYQYTNGKIEKLSHDHSFVGYMEEIGELTEEEAMNHPQRNVISRDVGSQFLESSGGDYIEVHSFPLIPNSILLLCSDGLCDMITSEQMKSELEKDISVQEKVANLIQSANNAGGKDNITVVLVELKSHEDILHDSHMEESYTEENELKVSVDDIQDIQKSEVSVSRIYIMIFLSFIFLILGYILGGYTGNKVFPTIFHDDIEKKSDVMNLQDSVVVELKKDTTELRQMVREKDTLIDVLQDALGYE